MPVTLSRFWIEAGMPTMHTSRTMEGSKLSLRIS